ncbi:maleylacetoacetate isomerase [Nostoc sp. HG1]|nr:maleylacetoacetate isomerase [Nostoc sp. HG1]
MTILHDYHRSSACYRVRIALNLKGVDYTRVAVDLVSGAQRAPDYVAVSAQGFVPMLEIDGHRLTQSLAIIDYLDARGGVPLLPTDAGERARVYAMALLIACDIHPLNNLRVLRYLDDPLGVGKETRDDWYRHWVSAGFDALERLSTNGTGACAHGPFLSGDAPGLADVCLVPQMYNARRFDVDVSVYPTLVAADAAMAMLDGVRAAHPDAPG